VHAIIRALYGIGLVLVGVLGFVIADFTHASLDDPMGRWRVILGASLIIWAAAFLAFFLLSFWAYGCSRALRGQRPDAIVIRSGSSPAFRALLESQGELRRSVVRLRPPFMQFVLLVDSGGLEIWHGSGVGRLTGSLLRESILSFSAGRTNDGVWPFHTIDVSVATDDGPHTLPFVVRGSTGFLSERKSEVDRVVRAIARLNASDVPLRTTPPEPTA
jgi:hypothetical protein